MKRALFALTIAGSIVTTTAMANEVMDENRTRADFEKITISDEYAGEVKKIERSPMAVSVVDVSKFRGRNINLNDVLKRVAGLSIRQAGGLGSATHISIHGLEGKRVQLFVDGKPLEAPDGTFGINDVPIQFIERIEIYKGVVPARFGGDTLGGAINVVIKEFTGDYVDLTYSHGSYNTKRFAWALTEEFEDFYGLELGLGGFYNRAENDYRMKSPYVKGLEIKRDHDAYESLIFSGSATLRNVWWDEVLLELVHYESIKEIQGIKSNIQSAENRSRLDVVVLELDREDAFVEGFDIDYAGILGWLEGRVIDRATECEDFYGASRPCPGGIGELDNYPHNSRDKQFDVRHMLNLNYALTPEHALNLNHVYIDSEKRPSDPLAEGYLGYDLGAHPSELQTNITGLSYEYEHESGVIANSIALKRYAFQSKVTSQARSVTGELVVTDQDQIEYGFTEAFRYAPQSIEGLYLKASYEHAYRMPDADELFGDGIRISSAPELKPEQSDNYNLGFLYDSNHVPWVKSLKVEGLWFYRHLEDMIKLDGNSFTVGYVNLGEIEAQGVEIEVKSDLTDNIFFYMNATSQSVKDVMKYRSGTNKVPNPTYNKTVPNLPMRFASGGLEWHDRLPEMWNGVYTLFWEGYWSDEYFYGWELSRYQEKRVKAQTQHTLGVQVAFDDDTVVSSLEVRNLTDEDAMDLYNMPLPGRTYHFNLRYTWIP